MKANRYVAILVFILAGAWVLTGEFSFVGSATGQSAEPAPATETENAPSAVEERALQPVSVAAIPAFDHARTVRVSGVTKADKRTVLTAREGGIIAEIPVRQGDPVKTGDLIARLAPEGRDAALRSAEQALEQARAEAAAREELVKRGTLPRLQLDAVMSALRQAESQVEQARSEIERLDVRAAFDGIVDAVLVEKGGPVGQGTPVANLIALNPLIGVGEINESDLATIAVGSPAQLRLVTGRTVEGSVRYISREAQAATRTFTVEVEVANPDNSIPAGMTAEVILRGTPVRATPVPRSVVTLDNDGNLGIRTVDDDDVVRFHPIDLVDDSTGALLLGGIPDNARVIVSGQNLVTDGQKVAVSEADPDLVKRLVDEARAGVQSQ